MGAAVDWDGVLDLYITPLVRLLQNTIYDARMRHRTGMSSAGR